MSKLNVFLLIAATAATIVSIIEAAPTPTPDVQANKRCPGGYSDGSHVDIGRYWYTCTDGQMVPKGCLADDKRRINLGDTFNTDKYQMLCTNGADGYVTFVYQGCVQNGHVHKLDEHWQSEHAWYVCRKDGDKPRVQLGGCVDQGGKRVALLEKTTNGDTVLQCNRTEDGQPKLLVAGCAAGGHKLIFGEKFDDPNGQVWYACAETGAKPVGCLRNGQRLQDNDRYFGDDGVIYTCKVNANANTGFVPSGCLQRQADGTTIERRIDCYWVEGKAPYQYEMTCKYDKNTNKAVKKQTRCVYKLPEGTYNLAPGCYQISADADSTAIGCAADAANGELKIKILDADDVDEAGLKKC